MVLPAPPPAKGADSLAPAGYRPSMITPGRFAAAILSGLGLAIASPPLNWAHLTWVLYVPLLWSLREDDTPGNTLLAYLTGYAGLCTCFFWLAETLVIYSNVPPVLCIVAVHLYALFFAIPWALAFSWVPQVRRRYGAWWTVLIPCWFVVLEFYVWSLFPFFVGSFQYKVLPVIQLASVTGTAGVSWLILFFNCAIAEWIYRAREGSRAPRGLLAGAVGLVLANAAWGAARIERVDAITETWPTARVTQIQHEVTMQVRMAQSAVETLRSWKILSDRLIREEVDLAVWPEGAILHDPRPNSAYRIRGFLENVTRNLGAPLLLGAGFSERKVDPDTGRKFREYRNSVYLVNEDGELADRYDKMVPLPFGEYIPLADTFPILKEWIQGPGDFEAGDRSVVFETPGFRFTVAICYEAILGPFIRKNHAGGDLIINVTNDGWFGSMFAPHQHAMLSINRTVELGIPMYRVAYTGVSLNADPVGRITHETAPYEEVARVVEIKPGRIDTFYRKHGDWFPALCLLLSVLAAVGLRFPVTPARQPA